MSEKTMFAVKYAAQYLEKIYLHNTSLSKEERLCIGDVMGKLFDLCTAFNLSECRLILDRINHG